MNSQILRTGLFFGILIMLIVVGIFVGKRSTTFLSHEQPTTLSYFVDSGEGGVQEVHITDDKTGKELCAAQSGKDSFDTHQIANILMRYRCQIFKDTASTDKQVNNHLFMSQENNSYLIVPLSDIGDNRLAKVHIEYGYGSLKHPFDTDTYNIKEFSVAPSKGVFQLASKDGQFFIYAS